MQMPRALLALLMTPLLGASGPAPVGAGADWPSHNGDAAETAFSRLDQITTANISRLGLAWSLDLPGEVTLEATPVAVGGVLYFTGSHAEVYAVDGASGRRLWTYDPAVWRHDPLMLTRNFAANRGVAYAHGRVFAAALDGRLFALDAHTGALLWSVATVPPASPQYVTGAPRTFDGMVIIGQAGADFGARGYVTAYDQNTGRQVWRFYVTPGSPAQNRGDRAQEAAAWTWNGQWWKTGTGGGPWNDITFDPDLDRIYVGTGNAAPIDPRTRGTEKGDDLYTASIVALDARTGRYLWHYQLNPRDSWDYDATSQMTLADLTLDGHRRKVLMQAPKNGFLYVIDRSDGRLLAADKIVKVTWASRIDLATGRPVEAPEIRFQKGDVILWPNPAGAHSWQAQAWDPQTGLMYLPVTQNGVHYGSHGHLPGGFDTGGLSIASERRDPHDGHGALLAWNPVTMQPAWEDWHAPMLNGGVMASAGGLVFQGTGDGWFTAYDAAGGKVLWRFDAGLGIIAAPMSYAVRGRQYVALLVGWGGSAGAGSDVMNVGWKYGANPRRLLAFALDGHAVLPPGAKPSLAIHPLDDPALRIDPAAAERGRSLFLACAVCHGRDAVSAGAPGPDLRESALALDPQAFLAVVKGGALLARGMPRYDQLGDAQALDIWAYVRSRARDALAGQAGSAPH
ncbi:MAG: PQQ-dependent dehydrogenase, methanol/ethanol family [Sphingomonadales bacterium]|nr:PQQ-dependent dehydrogenase, methanol/ethanol family [Sphingomonadales bacterium]